MASLRAVAIVRARLNRGVVELRIDFGPGYRIYFGRRGYLVVVLLCGGDKRTQARDIQAAQQYWKEYLNAEATE